MRKKIFKFLLAFMLLFGFAFSLASCGGDNNPVDDGNNNENNNNNDNNNNNNNNNGNNNGNQGGNNNQENQPKILTELPDGYYADLLMLPNSFAISFKDCVVEIDDDKKLEIKNDSFINVAYIDETLKANAYLNLAYTELEGCHLGKFYLSLDDEFILRAITSFDVDFDSIIDLEENMPSEITYYSDELYDENIIYKEFTLSKESLINQINSLLEENGIDFDLNEIDSLDDITSLIGISDDKIEDLKSKGNEILDFVMALLFDVTFADNEITSSLKFDSIKMINLLLENMTVEDLVKLIIGVDTYDKIISLLTKTYFAIDTSAISPLPDKIYFTYNSETLEYEEVSNLTEWEENTRYFIDNKDLGQYSLKDLFKTSEDDESGIITVDELNSAIEKIFDVAGKILPIIMGLPGDGFDFISEINITEEDIIDLASLILGVFGGIEIDQYLLYKPVTGVTEWVNSNYYDEVYFEVEGLTSFDDDEIYFIKNSDGKYILVDTETTPFDSAETYYVFDLESATSVTKALKEPEAGITYYVNEEGYSYNEDPITFVTSWDPTKTYCTLEFVPQFISEFEDGVQYYKFSFDYFDFILVEEDEEFNEDQVYFILNVNIIDTSEVTEPDLEEDYFIYDESGNHEYILTHFDLDGTEYFKLNDDGSYEKVEDVTLRPEEGTVYYIGYYDYFKFVAYDDLTEFDPDIDYYVAIDGDEGSIFYEEVEIYESSIPDVNKTYYTKISLAEFLNLDAIKDVTVDEFITIILKTLGKIDFDEEFKITEFAEPIIDFMENSKIYDVIADFIDSNDPIYEAKIDLESFDEDVDYYIYDEEADRYEYVYDSIFDDEETYYVLKPRTSSDVSKMIADFIDNLEENLKFEIVSDNEANLKKITLSLNFEKVKGEISVDFTKAYTDTLKNELSKYKAYASIDDDSTKLFEDILNDTIFDGYNNYGQSYSIIKEDDSIIGFKTINNIGGATVEYIFENQTDDVSSECYYYADNFMKYSVYLEGSNGFWERFYFIYDLTNKKFVTDDEVEYYVYNIETKEFEFIDTDTLPLREDFENPFIIMTVRKLSKIYSYQIQF